MLISKTHNFVFIRVPKAAGTSIEAALQPYAMPGIDGLFSWHAFARDAKRVIQNWEQYFRFGFVRNPWDAQLSMYRYVMRMGPTHPEWAQVSGYQDFPDYINRHLGALFQHGHARIQRDFLFDDDGKCLVDYIGRFEELAENFSDVCCRLGLGRIALPRLNSSTHDHYRDYYNSVAADIIRELYSRDIQTFGYSF